MADYVDQQADEIEALKSIYEDNFADITQDPPCFMVKIPQLEDANIAGPVSLRITFPAQYPDEVPVIEVPMRSRIMSSEQCSALLAHLTVTAENSLGMAMVFTLVDEAQQWIISNIHPDSTDPSTEQEHNEDSTSPSSVPRILKEAKVTGGKWDFVIGLVGKPSAGKSTFFNAATTLELAKTGAHPFTTIEPNIGKAFYSIPCPCSRMSKLCDAAHGHDFQGDRHVPVLLKDVAGLVPGAWEGKGRGNRFLNDLLDADVLIHILDVSGQTDEKGQETEDYDPSKDVLWIQEELHLWIYQNIRDKWDAICRRPQKLVDMFTGYHATRPTIHHVLHRAGIADKELSVLSSWSEDVLHRIVKEFLDVRFPILLVLNKCDTEHAAQNIQRLQETHPDIPCIAVSAGSECCLQSLQKAGAIDYSYGSNSFRVPQSLEESHLIRLQHIKDAVLSVYGSTNVHKAVCTAVNLKNPVYAFPVQCLETFRSLGKVQHQEVAKDIILKDCLSLKPGTTVDDLHSIMVHYPVNLCTGDFVRAETVDDQDKKRPVKKEDRINDSNNIIKIMTTKRSHTS